MLEYGALDDAIQIIEPGKDENRFMSLSRVEFWRGFVFFLSKFSTELLEERFIRKFPSTPPFVLANLGTVHAGVTNVLYRVIVIRLCEHSL
jgi:hypothetical protein